MPSFVSKKNALLLIVGIAIVCGAAFAYTVLDTHITTNTPRFDAKAVFASLDSENEIDDYLELEGMIGDVMQRYGTKAGFALIDEGERQGVISNDQCHGLLHYVGHAAYAENPSNYDALLSVVEGTNCIGGYLHGIEAEIVLNSSNVVADVQNFCTFQKERGVNPGPCYHGVGHAATELYKYDVPKALALCDALLGEPEEDLTNCYRGIFSEVGNVVVGYDGHTGLQVDALEIEGLSRDNPFAWCEAFAPEHQSSCKSQLVKVAWGDGSPETWHQSCLKPGIDLESQRICTNIVSGVYIRHALSFEQTATLPKIIDSFSEELQQIAVLGSAEAFSGYFSDNAHKDWEPFCDSFSNSNTVSYCYEVFTDMINNGTAPWMERTDIR